MPVHLTKTSLGCEKKPGDLEKAHTDTGRTCRLHTNSSPGWKLIFFLSVLEQNEVTQGPTLHLNLDAKFSLEIFDHKIHINSHTYIIPITD